MQTSDVNRPEVVAEVEAVFKEYERALTENTVQDLTGLFWDNLLTLRDRRNALWRQGDLRVSRRAALRQAQ